MLDCIGSLEYGHISNKIFCDRYTTCFKMPPAKSRKSYTAGFKLEVVKFAEENGGNMAAQRKYGISEKSVREWRKAKDTLRTTKKTKKANRGKHARWGKLEETLEEYVLSQRAACRGLSTIQLRLKAKELAKESGIDDFQGGPSWCFRFMRRKGLSMRQRTTMAQKLPEDMQEKLATFQEFVQSKRQEVGIADSNLLNMDEVPLTFDIPMNRTIDVKGQDTVTIRTTGHEKSSFTVVLACSADGNKLPPMVIFKRKTQPKEKFPKGVVVEVNEKGWMDNEMMGKWIDKCYSRRRGGFFSSEDSMLVMDSMCAHISDVTKDKFKTKRTVLSIIPGGMTKLLQPLDISVNRCFKAELRKTWELWMSSGDHSFTKTGRMRRASYVEVCQWVLDAWTSVPKTVIVNGFIKAGIINREEEIEEVEMETDTDSELTAELAAIFNSDTEDEDFDGFSDVE